jgi:Luciferase-like monooxygenase
MPAWSDLAGFDLVEMSDHYHPWAEAQGHSAFTSSLLSAIAMKTEPIGLATGVTGPSVHYHPATSAETATSAIWPPQAACSASRRADPDEVAAGQQVHAEQRPDARSITPCVVGGHSSSSARRVRALRTAFASASLLKYTNTPCPARSHSPIRSAHQHRSASG